MFYTVYKITNNLNGRYYIGIHQTEDLNDKYFGSGSVIIAAVKKYGRSNFTKEYLAIFENKEDMIAMEIQLVTEAFIQLEETYNLRIGGIYYGGEPHSDERKAKIGAASARSWAEGRMDHIIPKMRATFQERAKAGVHNSFLGKKHSEKTIAILSAKAKKRTGSKNSSFGSKWMHNRKLRITTKVRGPEVDQLLSQGWKFGRVTDFDAPIKSSNKETSKTQKLSKPISERNLKRKVSDEDYIRALNEHPSICQALIALGLAPRGKNYTRAKRLLGYGPEVRLTTTGKPKPSIDP